MESHRDAEGLSDADTLLQQMRNQDIALGPCGLPQRVGIVPQHAADALRPLAPASHLHAALNKQASQNMRRHILGSEVSLRDKARIRSCGGPTAVRLFTSRNHASDDVMSFDDDAMAGAVRWRLGMQQFGGQARRCKLSSVGHAGEAVEEVQQRAMRGECGTAMDV